MADETNSEETTTPKTVTPPEKTADGVTFTPEQQAHIDRLIGDARVKAKTRAKADIDKAAAKAAETAETARLAEQEQFKELSEKHAARIAELEPLEAQVATYRETIGGLLTVKLEALGEQATAAVKGLPGELDALAKLTWLNANEGLFATAPPPKIGATATGTDNGDTTFTDDEVKQYAAELNVDPRFVNHAAMAADLQARARS